MLNNDIVENFSKHNTCINIKLVHYNFVTYIEYKIIVNQQ